MGGKRKARKSTPGAWRSSVLGRELIVDGKPRLSGMVRPAMDANLSYDYMRSRQVQSVGLGTINPWLVADSPSRVHPDLRPDHRALLELQVAQPFELHLDRVDAAVEVEDVLISRSMIA